jgi:hypothetical protein
MPEGLTVPISGLSILCGVRCLMHDRRRFWVFAGLAELPNSNQPKLCDMNRKSGLRFEVDVQT